MRRPDSPHTLVLVASSGRSGTSLMSGTLQRLGFHVPQPEVPADETNPKGFGESQWVVDFHTRLLQRAGVQTSDARPSAWALTAEVALDREVAGELRTWLKRQFAIAPDVLIKDPRLLWFLPLWRRCAAELGVEARIVTMLRHPAAVVASKTRWYGEWQGQVARTAGWVNQALFLERATRESPRVLVHYDDLLEDWTRVVGQVGEALGLAVVRDAPVARIRRVHEFVDRSLSRSRPDWGDVELPVRLREQADEVWALLSALAAAGPDEGVAEIGERLDDVRGEYVELYTEAAALAQSTVAAAARAAVEHARRRPVRLLALLRRLPSPLRHALPLRGRVAIARALRGGDARRAVVS
jgi:hypothetical protein